MADDNFPLITVNSSIARSEVVAGLAHTHTHAQLAGYMVLNFLNIAGLGQPLSCRKAEAEQGKGKETHFIHLARSFVRSFVHFLVHSFAFIKYKQRIKMYEYPKHKPHSRTLFPPPPAIFPPTPFLHCLPCRTANVDK